MSNLKEKLYNPWVVVTLSVSVSILVYLIIGSIVDIPAYELGLALSTIIPFIVALPISIVMTRYHKKINQQKEELQRLDLINKKLFSVIAHDIRSPIATLKGFINVIVDEDMEMEEGKAYLNKITRRIDNLLVFLNDLLQWSKRQIDKKPIEFTLIESREVIRPILELYNEILERKDIQLNLGKVNQQIYADKDTYSFVVRNIYQNAIKFTPKRGTISISVEEKENEIHTIIEDNGIGISAENLDKLLNSDEWFSTAGTLDEKGTGLGIKTCIQYLKAQNGELLIDSQIGSGTKISIVLPKEGVGVLPSAPRAKHSI